ncbi:hypothetical protein HYH03_010538 [Edaphochlamys debaryana]|uniref:Uncharacterized protein n=1 Tax=Edaphochlamys debaryana TaxID=47281 RepID=A0A836BXE8_9CHLO|nr:hypothetical protein HYH03_010538 [Edaphochlamys debaryana]|eukprot:KAG2491094.1 hypothetical protein HYH03_010538 [Edaphochlamys debaryana]
MLPVLGFPLPAVNAEVNLAEVAAGQSGGAGETVDGMATVLSAALTVPGEKTCKGPLTLAALLEASEAVAPTLQESAASSLVGLVARELGAAIAATDMPPALQLAALKAADTALKTTPTSGNVCEAVARALEAKHGIRWSCVKGWDTYYVYCSPGTRMQVEMQGTNLVIFQGR